MEEEMDERPWYKYYDEGVPRHIDYPERSSPKIP
jgi:hypothetical protein